MDSPKDYSSEDDEVDVDRMTERHKRKLEGLLARPIEWSEDDDIEEGDNSNDDDLSKEPRQSRSQSQSPSDHFEEIAMSINLLKPQKRSITLSKSQKSFLTESADPAVIQEDTNQVARKLRESNETYKEISKAVKKDQTFSLRELKKLRRIFEDLNNNEEGMIFRVFIEKVGPIIKHKANGVSLHDLEVLFKRIDANANGSVDWFEISDFLLMNDVKTSAKAVASTGNLQQFEREAISRQLVTDHPATRYLYHAEPATRLLINLRYGHYYTSSTDGTAKMWNPDTLRHERTFHSSRAPIMDMMQTTWDDAIGVLAMDGTANFYDPESGELRRVYRAERKREVGIINGGRRVVDDRRGYIHRPVFTVPISTQELEEIRYSDETRSFGKIEACAPHLAHFVKDREIETIGLENLGWLPRAALSKDARTGLRGASSVVNYSTSTTGLDTIGSNASSLASAGYISSMTTFTAPRSEKPTKLLFGLESGHIQMYDVDMPSAFGQPISIPNALTLAAHQSAISSIRACETMKLIFTASHDGTLQVRHWDRIEDFGVTLGEGALTSSTSIVEEYQPTFIDIAQRGHTRRITSMDWSLRGRLLISSASERDALVWSPYLPKPIMKLEGEPMCHLLDVRFCDDANQILTLSSNRTIKLWDMRTFRCIHTLRDSAAKREKDKLLVAAYDRRKSAVVLGTTYPRQWLVVNNGKYSLKYNGHKLPIVGMVLSAQFGQLVTADEKYIIVWDAVFLTIIVRWRVMEGISSITLDTNGRRLLVATLQGKILVYNYVNAQLLKQCHPHRPPASLPDGDQSLQAVKNRTTNYERPWVEGNAEASRSLKKRMIALAEKSAETEAAAALAPETERDAKGHEWEVDVNEQLILHSTEKHDEKGDASLQEKRRQEARFVCFGEIRLPHRQLMLMSGFEEGTAAIFADDDAADSYPQRMLDIRHVLGGAYCGVIVQPSWLVVGSNGSLVYQSTDDSTGKTVVMPLLSEKTLADAQLFHKDSTMIPTGKAQHASQCKVALFPQRGLMLDPLPAFQRALDSRDALIVEARMSTMTGEGGSLFDLDAQRKRQNLPTIDVILMASGVQPFLLVTGSSDGILQFWSGRSMSEIFRLRATLLSGDGITALCTSVDSKYIAVGDSSGYISIFDISLFIDANQLVESTTVDSPTTSDGTQKGAGFEHEEISADVRQAFAFVGQTRHPKTIGGSSSHIDRSKVKLESEAIGRAKWNSMPDMSFEDHMICLLNRFKAHDGPVASLVRLDTSSQTDERNILRRDNPEAFVQEKDADYIAGAADGGRLRYVFSGGTDSFVYLWDVIDEQGISCVGDPSTKINPLPLCTRANNMLDTCRRQCIVLFIQRYEQQVTIRLQAQLTAALMAERKARDDKHASVGDSTSNTLGSGLVRHGRRIGTRRQEEAERKAQEALDRERFSAIHYEGATLEVIYSFVATCIARQHGAASRESSLTALGDPTDLHPSDIPSELTLTTAWAFSYGTDNESNIGALVKQVVTEMCAERNAEIFLTSSGLHDVLKEGERDGETQRQPPSQLPPELLRATTSPNCPVYRYITNPAFGQSIVALVGVDKAQAYVPGAVKREVSATAKHPNSPSLRKSTFEGSYFTEVNPHSSRTQSLISLPNSMNASAEQNILIDNTLDHTAVLHKRESDEDNEEDNMTDSAPAKSHHTNSHAPQSSELFDRPELTNTTASANPFGATSRKGEQSNLGEGFVHRPPKYVASISGMMRDPLMSSSQDPREVEQKRLAIDEDLPAFDLMTSTQTTGAIGKASPNRILLKLSEADSKVAHPLTASERTALVSGSQSSIGIALEALSRGTAVVVHLIMKYGSAVMKAKYLPLLVGTKNEGPRRKGALCVADAGAKDALTHLSTTLHEESNNHAKPNDKSETTLQSTWVLKGSKVCLTDHETSDKGSLSTSPRKRPNRIVQQQQHRQQEANDDAAVNGTIFIVLARGPLKYLSNVPVEGYGESPLALVVVDEADFHRELKFTRRHFITNGLHLTHVSFVDIPITRPTLQILGALEEGRGMVVEVLNHVRMGIPHEVPTVAAVVNELLKTSEDVAKRQRERQDEAAAAASGLLSVGTTTTGVNLPLMSRLESSNFGSLSRPIEAQGNSPYTQRGLRSQDIKQLRSLGIAPSYMTIDEADIIGNNIGALLTDKERQERSLLLRDVSKFINQHPEPKPPQHPRIPRLSLSASQHTHSASMAHSARSLFHSTKHASMEGSQTARRPDYTSSHPTNDVHAMQSSLRDMRSLGNTLQRDWLAKGSTMSRKPIDSEVIPTTDPMIPGEGQTPTKVSARRARQKEEKPQAIMMNSIIKEAEALKGSILEERRQRWLKNLEDAMSSQGKISPSGSLDASPLRLNQLSASLGNITHACQPFDDIVACPEELSGKGSLWDTSDKTIALVSGAKGVVYSHGEEYMAQRLREAHLACQATSTSESEVPKLFIQNPDTDTRQIQVGSRSGRRGTTIRDPTPTVTEASASRPTTANTIPAREDDEEVFRNADDYFEKVLGVRILQRRMEVGNYVTDKNKRALIGLPSYALTESENARYQRGFLLSDVTDRKEYLPTSTPAFHPRKHPTSMTASDLLLQRLQERRRINEGDPPSEGEKDGRGSGDISEARWLGRIHSQLPLSETTPIPKPVPSQGDAGLAYQQYTSKEVMQSRENAWLRLLTNTAKAPDSSARKTVHHSPRDQITVSKEARTTRIPKPPW